ncbi:MAG TPA: SAVMC3_10250 family protein [Trebonia sp.]
MRELIYLSESKLSTFYPGRTSHSVQFTGGLALGPVSAKIDVSPPSSEADESTALLNQAVRYLEREAVDFSYSALNPGKWIFFDLNMGYGTSYKDSGIHPKIDDIALFQGSLKQVGKNHQSPTDLLLCGIPLQERQRGISS